MLALSRPWETPNRTAHNAPRTADMLALSACLLSAVGPVWIDLATLTPDQADRLSSFRRRCEEERPALVPQCVGTYSGWPGTS